MILETHHVDWPNEAACADFAAALGRALLQIFGATLASRSLYIELHGHLGAGKTTFTRYLLGALGVAGRVKSPTYAVLEPYTVALPEGAQLEISHFDFYRFNDPQEWEDAGFRDIFGRPGLKLAEWPEQATGLLPTPDLRLSILPQVTLQDPLQAAHESASPTRSVTCDACSAQGQQVLANLPWGPRRQAVTAEGSA